MLSIIYELELWCYILIIKSRIRYITFQIRYLGTLIIEFMIKSYFSVIRLMPAFGVGSFETVSLKQYKDNCIMIIIIV